MQNWKARLRARREPQGQSEPVRILSRRQRIKLYFAYQEREWQLFKAALKAWFTELH